MWQELLDEEKWLQQVSSDAEASLVGRWTQMNFRIACADQVPQEFQYASGKLSRGQSTASAETISFSGSAAAWRDFLKAIPAAPNNHFLGMQRRRDDFTIDGMPQFIRHLRLLTRIFEIARECSENAETKK